MNILKEIYSCLGEESREVKIALYPDEEICFYLWERELPILITKNNDHCYLESPMDEFELTVEMLEEVLRVMKVIDKNILEIKNWVKI